MLPDWLRGYDSILRPNPFWKLHQVYSVASRTWPHIPDCRVAVDPEGQAWVLAGHGDRISAGDPIGNFNRAALRERLEIGDENIPAYLRFVIECHIAAFSPSLFVGDGGTARRILQDLDRDWRSDGLPPDLGVRKTPGEYGFEFQYWEWWRAAMVGFQFTVRRDGTIHVDERDLPRSG